MKNCQTTKDWHTLKYCCTIRTKFRRIINKPKRYSDECWIVSWVPVNWTSWVISETKKIFLTLLFKLKEEVVTLLTSLFHVSSHFLHSTLDYLGFILFPSVHTLLFMFHFISFSPQPISFISSTIVYLIYNCFIWLQSYYIAIQP